METVLLGQKFIIRIDHRSLKKILAQVIQTPYQEKYSSKLLGYDYDIVYQSGAENTVADALSRKHEEIFLHLVLSFPLFDFTVELRHEYTTLLAFQQMIEQMEVG